MKLQTDRLELIALTPEQLRLWLEDRDAFERDVNCRYAGEPLTGLFRDIVKGQYDIALGDGENLLWHTFWLIVRQCDRTAVGSADFKRPPDGRGRVELGYGLGAAHRGQGYMTEAVGAMCRWALEQPAVREILAETDTDNLPSQAVLRRNGFQLICQDESLWSSKAE